GWIHQIIQHLGVLRTKHLVVTPVRDLPDIGDWFRRAVSDQGDPTWRRYLAFEAFGASSPATMGAANFRWTHGFRFNDRGPSLLVSLDFAGPKKPSRARLSDHQPDASNAFARCAARCGRGVRSF